MELASTKPDERRSSLGAIAIICAGVLAFVFNDAIAKYLTAFYPPAEILFLRNLIALPIVLAIVLRVAGRAALRTRHAGVHALRGLLLAGSAVCFFLALDTVPLAEATAIFFVAPIFITALSVPLLREHVGWRRWTSVIIGFAGVLLIVRPGGAAFEAASLLPIAAALFYALGMIGARWIDRSEGVWTMMVYVVLFPALFSGGVAALQWQTPALSHLPVFLAMALFGTIGMTLTTHAFRLAPAAVIAPFDYTALIWASMLGWLFWAEIPDLWTYVGAAIVIASGLYIVVRETRRTGAGR